MRVCIYVWCVWNPFSGFDDIILLYVPLKNGGEIPSKRNILYDIIMRRDLEKVDVALLQSSFE